MTKQQVHQQRSLTGMELALQRMRERLEELGYTDLRSPFTLMEIEPGKTEHAALVAFDDDEPIVLCHPVDEGEAEKLIFQEEAKFKAGIVMPDNGARFVWVSDGSFDFYFHTVRESPVPELPTRDAWRREARDAMSTSRRRHLQVMGKEYFRGDYRSIGHKFNELHEEIYRRRAGVGTTNEAIDEVCKLIFLKIHLERHPNYEVEALGGKRFAELFNADYINKYGSTAIQEIRDSFHEIKRLDEYAELDITERLQTIFAPDEPFRLNNPEVLAFAVGIFENLRLSIDDRVDRRREHEDLLGKAFDIFLRGKYVSSGGLATYLTPHEVVEAMTRIAFHDIKKEDYRRLWAGYSRKPEFLVGDLTCGTGRFLIGALSEVKRLILKTVYTRADEELTDPQESCKLRSIKTTSSGEQPCEGVRQ
jgi:type I restriction enzyme M protein